MSTNNFDYFDYDLVKNQDQKGYDLVGNLIESQSSSSMKFSVHHDDLYKSALLINYTKKRLLFGNDVTFFDFIVGDNLDIILSIIWIVDLAGVLAYTLHLMLFISHLKLELGSI